MDRISNGNSCQGQHVQNSRFKNLNGAGFQALNHSGLYCVHCLHHDHIRDSCTSLIVCLRCKGMGHVALNCLSQGPDKKVKVGFQPKQAIIDSFQRKSALKGKSIDISGWFKGKADGLSSSSPPVFQSFSDFAQSLRPAPALLHNSTALCTDLTIFTGSQQTQHPPLVEQTKPSSPRQDQTASAKQMAFQVADPTPFMPRGFHHQEVPGRKIMARAVTRRAAPNHEGWAILTIEPLPLHEVQFANIREISLEFLT
jgi:hypothetical protein